MIAQYPELDRDVKAKLIKDFGDMMTENNKDLSTLLTTISSLENTNEKLTSQHADLNTQLSKLQSMYTTTQTEITTLKEQVKSLSEQAKSQPKNQTQQYDSLELTPKLLYAIREGRELNRQLRELMEE